MFELFRLSQSANEIGAVVSPYEAIHDIFKYRAKYPGNEDVVSQAFISRNPLPVSLSQSLFIN